MAAGWVCRCPVSCASVRDASFGPVPEQDEDDSTPPAVSIECQSFSLSKPRFGQYRIDGDFRTAERNRRLVP